MMLLDQSRSAHGVATPPQSIRLWPVGIGRGWLAYRRSGGKLQTNPGHLIRGAVGLSSSLRACCDDQLPQPRSVRLKVDSYTSFPHSTPVSLRCLHLEPPAQTGGGGGDCGCQVRNSAEPARLPTKPPRSQTDACGPRHRLVHRCVREKKGERGGVVADEMLFFRKIGWTKALLGGSWRCGFGPSRSFCGDLVCPWRFRLGGGLVSLCLLSAAFAEAWTRGQYARRWWCETCLPWVCLPAYPVSIESLGLAISYRHAALPCPSLIRVGNHRRQQRVRQQVVDTLDEWGGSVVEPEYTRDVSTSDIINAIQDEIRTGEQVVAAEAVVIGDDGAEAH